MRTWIAVGLGIAIIAGAAFVGPLQSPETDETPSTDEVDGTEIQGEPPRWMTTELQRIRSNETFTVASLDRPVLLEMFAVWCPTCTAQQDEIKKLHEQHGDIVRSVSLNIDPNEDRDKVWRHVKRHNFTWRYTIAPPAMSSSLVEEFGTSIVNAPRAPKILVCNNSFRRLSSGVSTAETLKQEIETGCT